MARAATPPTTPPAIAPVLLLLLELLLLGDEVPEGLDVEFVDVAIGKGS